GVDRRVGSIEAGKSADLVIFNGPPMSLRSQIIAVYKNGKLQYEYENE
nr:amidohydrolase family protein [bacterium]